jgi:hypothetical protein
MDNEIYNEIMNGVGVIPDTWFFYEESVESYNMIVNSILNVVNDCYIDKEINSNEEYEIDFTTRINIKVNGCYFKVNKIFIDCTHVYFEYYHGVTGHSFYVDVRHEELEDVVCDGVWCE